MKVFTGLPSLWSTSRWSSFFSFPDSNNLSCILDCSVTAVSASVLLWLFPSVSVLIFHFSSSVFVSTRPSSYENSRLMVIISYLISRWPHFKQLLLKVFYFQIRQSRSETLWLVRQSVKLQNKNIEVPWLKKHPIVVIGFSHLFSTSHSSFPSYFTNMSWVQVVCL